MDLSERIKEILNEYGVSYKEKQRTIYTACPVCGRDDKFSILKANGSSICYRTSCDFGKSSFTKWLAITGKMSYADAKKKLLYGDLRYTPEDITTKLIEIGTDSIASASKEDKLEVVEYPAFGQIPIASAESTDGLNYLESRGITLAMAQKYQITYDPVHRRVVLPVIIGGKVYGYQARAIDKVPDKYRMRNNEGFRRDRLLMFADNIKATDFVILCEGPFDAMKFDRVGGFVCTMGKTITDMQLRMALPRNIKKIYLALDEDADAEMNKILSHAKLPVYRIEVPQSCLTRCAAKGSKADFGECTIEEATQAFENARKVDTCEVFVHLDGGWDE